MNRVFLFTVSCVVFTISCMHTPTNKKLSANEFRIKAYSTQNALILDVRQAEEYVEGHLKNAVNIPWNDESFVETVSSIDKEKPIFLYCLTGGRSSPAAETMHKMGFMQLYELEGGILTWRAKGLPQEGTVPLGMDRNAFELLANNNVHQLIFFKANWNKNSYKLMPTVKAILKEINRDINLVFVDVDSNQQLTQRLEIDAIPTLHLYENGKLVWQYTGMPDSFVLYKNLQ